MNFEDYVKEGLDNIKDNIKEVKQDQQRHNEKLDDIIEAIQEKNQDQDQQISDLDKRVTVNRICIDSTKKEVKILKKSAWGLLSGLLLAAVGILSKLVFWK